MITLKSNKIPVRQDGATNTPPVGRVETCSDGSSTPTHASAIVERGQGEGVILPLSPDFYHSPAHKSLIASERGNPFLNDAPDQPGTLVFIEFGRSGIAVPCLHFPFNHEREVANAR